MKNNVLFYEYPIVEVVDIEVERGFANSEGNEGFANSEGNEGVGDNEGSWG